MGNIKISQLTPKGANLESTDLLEISEFDGSGYVTKSITGQEIIDAAGDFVPYTGATQNVDLGNEDLLVNEIFLYDGVNNNYGSIHFTDANFHIENASGLPMLVVEDGFIQLHKTSFVQSNLYTTGLSATRDHYLPNASGTIALTSDVATKQDILVSGTNIKTLNGASLLGSGGLSVEPSITAGTTSQYFRGDKTFQTLDKTAVGLANVDNTSDSNKPVSTAQATAIGLKQDTLVSGTNIKTINGSSVLGGGDLVVGGGGSGVNAQITLGTGNVYSNIPNGASNLTVTGVLNTIYLMPFKPSVTFTTSNILFNVSSAVLTTNSRILIYSHSAITGLPDTKLYESTDISVGTIGIKTITTSQTFTAGVVYWLGFYSNGASAYSASSADSQMVIGLNSSAGIYNSISRTVTYGSAPTTWGTTHTKTSNNFMRIGLTSS